jgi:hypothetical protein
MMLFPPYWLQPENSVPGSQRSVLYDPPPHPHKPRALPKNCCCPPFPTSRVESVHDESMTFRSLDAPGTATRPWRFSHFLSDWSPILSDRLNCSSRPLKIAKSPSLPFPSPTAHLTQASPPFCLDIKRRFIAQGNSAQESAVT